MHPAVGVSSLQTPRSDHGKMKRRNGAGANQNVSVIASGARIVGDVHTSGVIHVAGTVVGNIRAGRQVLVVKGGMIEGVIEAPEAIIAGEVRGPVRATNRVAVQASATLHGTITTPRLAVEEGATLDVELCMREPETLLDLNHRHAGIRKLSSNPAITHEDKNVVGPGIGEMTA